MELMLIRCGETLAVPSKEMNRTDNTYKSEETQIVHEK